MRFHSAADRHAAELAAVQARTSNRLDRAIQWAFPGWAVKRAQARHALSVKALSDGYDAARSTRLRQTRRGRNASADALLAYGELEEMRERARDLVRNDSLGSRIARAFQNNVVGEHGIEPTTKVSARALGITEAQADEWNGALDDLWDAWAPRAMADGTSIQAGTSLAMRKIVEDGEALALPIMSQQKGRPFEIALQIIEGDRLDNPGLGGKGEGPDRTRLRLGVEIGDEGEPLRYWIADRHPGDIGFGAVAGRLRRIFHAYPAVDGDGIRAVYHAYEKLRPGQTRGVPLVHAVMSDAQDLADIMEAEREAQRANACFAGFIKRTDPLGAAASAPTRTNPDGQRLEEMEPGIYEYLNPGEDIVFPTVQRPGGTWARFVELLTRRTGASVGLPYEFLQLDFSKTNYSSYRGSAIEAWRGFYSWQTMLVRELLWWVRFELVREAWLKGMLPAFAGDFMQRKELWLRAEWHGPRRESVDPTKDATNAQLELDMEITSPQIECSKRGRDWEQVQEDLVQWEVSMADRRKAAGLGPAGPKQMRPLPMPAPAQDAPPQDQQTQQTQDGADG